VSAPDDLIGDMIAEVARTHGVAICREDPIVAVVLLNQVVLRRYLEETVAPAAAAIREATRDAIDQVEKVAEAQAHRLDQVSLKDRASSWKTRRPCTRLGRRTCRPSSRARTRRCNRW